jgi:hypothetical protein
MSPPSGFKTVGNDASNLPSSTLKQMFGDTFDQWEKLVDVRG